MDCLFCSIVQGNIPAKVHFEDDEVLVFEDIHPKAPVHLLVIPKRHITSLAESIEEDRLILGQLLLTLAKVAKDKGLTGYKTAINTGREGGQVVDHLHLHLLGGKPGVGFGGIVLDEVG